LTDNKLYCLATEPRACEQLAQGCYLKAERLGIEPTTFESPSPLPNRRFDGTEWRATEY